MRLVARHDRVLLPRRCPGGTPISISGYHIREAGSTAAQELAFTLANGFAYVELAPAAGPRRRRVRAPAVSFFFNAHIDFFEEIGKYRAARRIWARWMRDRYGATNPRSLQLRFHTQTAGVSLTAQQPEVNIARTAIEALAGVLGGTQSLHTNSMDEALALPTEKAARIALRTQQVIAHETGVASASPTRSAGSYLRRALTDELERQAEEIFAHLDELGGGSILEGVHAGIENGYFQGAIADAAYDLERKINRGRRIVVGVNRFTEGNDDDTVDILQITAEQEAAQIKRLQAVKADRDDGGRAGGARPAARRRRRPRGQPDAGPDRRRAHLRHRGRDHGHDGVGVRPLRRGPRHLRRGPRRRCPMGRTGGSGLAVAGDGTRRDGGGPRPRSAACGPAPDRAGLRGGCTWLLLVPEGRGRAPVVVTLVA